MCATSNGWSSRSARSSCAITTPAPRLYITEMGWGSQYDPNVVAFEQGMHGQARELRGAYRYMLRDRHRLNLKAAYWFSWKDIPLLLQLLRLRRTSSAKRIASGPSPPGMPSPDHRRATAAVGPRGRPTNSIPPMLQPEAQGPAWLVLPTYNEADNIEAFVDAVLPKLPASAKVLIVDDNSPDGSGEIADRLAERHERIAVLHRPNKEGLGPAYIAGFRRALEGGAGLILEMDSDFSHDPAYLPRLLEAGGRADLAIGSRYVPGGGVSDWSALRRAISRGGSAYARLVLGVGVRDLTGGFKCFRREVLEAIDLDSIRSRGYAFQIEMTYRAIQRGFSVAEVPIVFRDRRAGTSKMDRSIVAEAAWRVPLLRFDGKRR